MSKEEDLENKILKQKVLIERATIVKNIVIKGLVNLVQVALLYTVVVVILPIIFNKDIKALRDVSLMTFIGLIFLFILILLIIVSIINEKTKSYIKARREFVEVISPKLQARRYTKKMTQENKDGKEMVRK